MTIAAEFIHRLAIQEENMTQKNLSVQKRKAYKEDYRRKNIKGKWTRKQKIKGKGHQWSKIDGNFRLKIYKLHRRFQKICQHFLHFDVAVGKQCPDFSAWIFSVRKVLFDEKTVHAQEFLCIVHSHTPKEIFKRRQ